MKTTKYRWWIIPPYGEPYMVEDLFNCSRAYLDCSCLDFWEIINDERCSPMQWTWLKDKNGKEIYDWDVVTWNTSYERDSDEYVWTKESPAYVNWIDSQAWFYPFTLWNRWRCDVCNIEVIGNIHENPELLNK